MELDHQTKTTQNNWTHFSVSDDDWTKSDAGKTEMGKSANDFYSFPLCERFLIFFFRFSDRKKNSIPKCLFPKYFSVSEFHDGKITAQCNLCARANILKFVRSYGAVTSNLNAHFKVNKCLLNSTGKKLIKFSSIQREHPQEFAVYRTRKMESPIFHHPPKRMEKFSSPSKEGGSPCVYIHLMN